MKQDDGLNPEPLNCLTAALYYSNLGFSVIPIGTNKKPLVEWKKYQYERATDDQIRLWWRQFPEANVGIVTGKISGIVVIDVEKDGSIDDLPKTVMARTGGGGWHLYYQYPGFEVSNATRIKPLTDIRGDGGYVIAPPSNHTSGNQYEWINQPGDKNFAELPGWVLEKRNSQTKTDTDWNETIGGAEEGQRNSSGASMIGKLISYLPEAEWEPVAWPFFKVWNSQNKPPLPLVELRSIYDSITSKERAKRQYNEEQIIIIPNALEFAGQDFGETEWLVENLVPVGGSVILVAKRESFKTWLALYIAHCIIKGLPLWGQFNTARAKVLYVANDDPVPSFKKRLSQFSFDESFFLYHQALPVFSIDQGNGSFNSVKSLIESEQIGLVIIDILRNTHNKDSNADKDAKAVFDKYKELRENNPNLVFLFLIHPSKENAFEKRFVKRQAEEAVGSYYWEASVDTVISLRKTTNDDQQEEVAVSVTKNKQSELKIKPFTGVRKAQGTPVEFIYEERVPDELKIELAKEFLLSVLAERDHQRQKLLDLTVESRICASRTAEKALGILVDEEKVTHTRQKPHIYSLVREETKDSANRNGIEDLRDAESSEGED